MKLNKVVISISICLCTLVNICYCQEEYYSGYIRTPKEILDTLPLAEFRPQGAFVLPENYDLSRFLPIPGDQGSTQGSCVGWTLGYALKSYHERIEENNPNLVFSPSYIYNQVLEQGQSCKRGIPFANALNFLKSEGCATIRDFPYIQNDCKTKPTVEVIEKSKRYNIVDSKLIYKYKLGGKDLDVDIVKTEIAFDTPVIVGILLDTAFWNNTYGDRNKARPYIWKNLKYDCKNCYHAMLAVGYDDNLGAIKVMNSYGTSFGDGGFAWISYDVFSKTVYEAYTAIDNYNQNRYYTLNNRQSKVLSGDTALTDDEQLYENWLKSGYYRNLGNDYRLSVVYLSKKRKEAIFKLYNIDENDNKRLLGSYKLGPNQTYSVNFDNKNVELTLDRIGAAGTNIFKPAAFYSVRFKENE